MSARFVHLNVHTEYSIVDGLVRIKPLMHALISRGMNTVAVTDFCNLFAAVKVFQAAVSLGIKPIIGGDLPCHFAHKNKDVSTLIVLCQNELGYRNLTCLISKAYQEGQYLGEPRVHYEWLHEYSEGLIALSGGSDGLIGQALLAGDMKGAIEQAQYLARIFPNRFYLEIQRTNQPRENLYNSALMQLAETLNLPLVASNKVRFLDKHDFEAHEARICINRGLSLADPRREHNFSCDQYLRGAQEMATLFADLPQAIENTYQISLRCNLLLTLGNNYLPNFPIPAHSTEKLYLSQLSQEGLEQRLSILLHQETPEQLKARKVVYEERLQLELDVINSMGFPGYFLIVADFIQWAKKNGIPVGPGRGSGAGSLVAYALGITDLDPLQYELLFERFLNPERVSMPDFDIDFCMEGRDRVIEYVAQKYGRHSVSQIITFGTMAAKAVVRDVGRVLGHPYSFVDKLAKLIPFELGITLTKALETETELQRRYQDEEEVKELLQLALKLEGITRNAGKHAGGVVIAPSKLTDFTAVYCEQGSTQIVSQFDKDDVESVGLVKFDFLGLRTLTIIDWAVRTINEQLQQKNQALLDISIISTRDAPTFDLLKNCQTTAVFQLESRGMKELINRLQPDCFEEIIALVALFRPGPLQSGMVDDFIDRKHGRSKVEYPHPDLEPILKPTYGVILYQEQVMQIAQVLANFTLGAADLLRRAMGKKKPEEMAKQRTIFIEGAVARSVNEQNAAQIFALMEKFAGYGFNKSHSAAYALVAYQTAWLKAHYPAAFMAAVLSSDLDNTDKIVVFINECKQMHLKIWPPCVNLSNYRFSVGAENSIIYGLGAIKGVGESAINCIVNERLTNGAFCSLFDFCQRLDLRKVNRRVLESLIKAGALDSWGITRASLLATIEKALKLAEKNQQNLHSGQADLFSFFGEEDTSDTAYLEGTPASIQVVLEDEKSTLGFYLSGHPTSHYLKEFGSYITPIKQLNPSTRKKAVLCGVITSIRKILTKRGKKLLILAVEDASSKADVVVFSEIADTYPSLLSTGQKIIIDGDVAHDDFSGGVKISATQLQSIADARVRFARFLQLTIGSNDEHLLQAVQSLLKAHSGNCLVQLHYKNEHACAKLSTAKAWSVLPEDALIDLLRQTLGYENVELYY